MPIISHFLQIEFPLFLIFLCFFLHSLLLWPIFCSTITLLFSLKPDRTFSCIAISDSDRICLPMGLGLKGCTVVNQLPVYIRNVFTVPLTYVLHIGHFLMAGAQSEQHTRCPQGRKAMEASNSRQILQRRWSRSCRFSSTNNSASSRFI